MSKILAKYAIFPEGTPSTESSSIGILFSSGYSPIVSQNYTGLIWNTDFPDEVNQNNMLLFLNEKRKIGNYDVDYLGKRKKLKNFSRYINENYLEGIPILNKFILKKDIDLGGKNFLENDKFSIFIEIFLTST